ncbi:hypothetical protein JHK85_054143 [Glycine max]|nr:hypothetical protein JHK85_054143 [Glycine max]
MGEMYQNTENMADKYFPEDVGTTSTFNLYIFKHPTLILIVVILILLIIVV